MKFQPQIFRTLFLALACVPSLLFAQQVGSKDLTISWRAPNDHIASPDSEKCPQIHATINHGNEVQTHPFADKPDTDVLALTISKIEPTVLHLDEDFTATVQVKNTGTGKISIPWQPDGEQAVSISKDSAEEKYEVADVNFHLTISDKKQPPIFLQSAGAVFANPEDHTSYIELGQGQWVEMKLRGAVTCAFERCPGEIVPAEHAMLSAWWYQRVLTHHVSGCNEDHGATTVRELTSTPFPVRIVKAAIPSEKQ
jgi:hypothetical protein